MKAVRAVGRDLMAAAQIELTIGNLVRRVLFLIREEHTNQAKTAADEYLKQSINKIGGSSGKSSQGSQNKRDRSNSGGSQGVNLSQPGAQSSAPNASSSSPIPPTSANKPTDLITVGGPNIVIPEGAPLNSNNSFLPGESTPSSPSFGT